MTTPVMTRSRQVDAGTAADLRDAYSHLVKAGRGSVQMAWRFGQNIDSHSDSYTLKQLAQALDLSPGTLSRYQRLYHAYQRPELAVAASEKLQTYDIGILAGLRDQLEPGRPLAGRHFRYQCSHCHSTDIRRLETDGDGQPLEPLEPLAAAMVPVIRPFAE
jgi:hypothetical protein